MLIFCVPSQARQYSLWWTVALKVGETGELTELQLIDGDYLHDVAECARSLLLHTVHDREDCFIHAEHSS